MIPSSRALEEQLQARGVALHLVVIGGSALLAMGLGDRPTEDVDVVAFWLNPGPTALLEIAGLPAGFAGRLTERRYGEALTVSFASRFDRVQLKLYALADRDEPRDEQDLRRLEPTDNELLAGAQWARRHNAPGPFDDQLAAALAKFGVEDVGRDA